MTLFFAIYIYIYEIDVSNYVPTYLRIKQYINTFGGVSNTFELLWAEIIFELFTVELIMLTLPSGASFSSSRNCFSSISENYIVENGASM